MKKLDVFMIVAIILLLAILQVQQIKKNREIQAQINELRIIVDQKFLPAMILENLEIR